jgi:predicted ATPase
VRMSRLFLITGIPAAGKSTVSHALARRFERGACVDGDDIRKMVVSGAAPLGTPLTEAATEQLLLRYRAGLAVAQVYLDAGFDVVFNDNMFGTLFADVLAMVGESESGSVARKKEAAHELHVVILNPRADAVRRRDATRECWQAYEGEAWDVDELRRGLVSETPRVGLWLDNSAQSVEETVDSILERLQESAVSSLD